jgi:hypothetical protein
MVLLLAAIPNLSAQPISQSQTNSDFAAREQQKQNNALALEAAKKLSISFSEQENCRAAATLNQLCQSGLVTDPRVIPYLIDALKLPDHRSDHLMIGQTALESLCMITRRMRLGVKGWPPRRNPPVDNSTNLTHIISWWENWWKDNENKHPVYDAEIDQTVTNAFLNVEKIIEEKIKPEYPELVFFKAGANSFIPMPPRYSVSSLYEYQYEPYNYDQGVYNPSSGKMYRWDELPWLEIKCRFDDEEMAGYPVHHPPESLEKYLTTVYSKKIEDLSIFIQVRIASSNTALVDDLKKALNP